MCEYTLCVTSYQVSVVTAMVQYPPDKTSISTGTMRYTDEHDPFLYYPDFQMRYSVTVSSQANNAPELVQYSCKLRNAEQDKTSLYMYTHNVLVM